MNGREGKEDVGRDRGAKARENTCDVGWAGGPGWCGEGTGAAIILKFFAFLSVAAKSTYCWYYQVLLDGCLICCCFRVASGDSDSGESRYWKREMLQNKVKR